MYSLHAPAQMKGVNDLSIDTLSNHHKSHLEEGLLPKTMDAPFLLHETLSYEKSERPRSGLSGQRRNHYLIETIEGKSQEEHTYCTDWDVEDPEFNRMHHLDQSMGISSTSMPEYTTIIPRQTYANIAHIVKQHAIFEQHFLDQASCQEVSGSESS